MFQRIRGAIDSTIAQEQARQRQAQASPSRSNSNPRRADSRAISPAKRVSRQGTRGRQDGDPPAKAPDPADFESEFTIEDEDLGRSGTLKPQSNQNGSIKNMQEIAPQQSSQEIYETSTSAGESSASSDLPTDIRDKLRKLEKYESRYHELLRSYRVAHARVLTIEPFETSLRENTPLTSISDPNAFVEYLNQVNLKGDMVLDELKRVSSERDTFKQRLSEAERSTNEAWDEVANLKSLASTKADPKGSQRIANGSQSDDEASMQEITNSDPLGVTTKSSPASINSPTVSAPGMTPFSPKQKAADSPKARQGSEEFFSYDGEVPRLGTELQDRQEKINALENEVTTLKGDLAVTRESTQSMVQTLEEATRELNGLRDSKDRSESDMKEQRVITEKLSERLRADLQEARTRLQDLQAEHGSECSDRITELDSQLQDSRQELDRAQLAASQNTNDKGRVEELQSDVSKLETKLSELRSNATESDKKIHTLNDLVINLRSQLSDFEGKNQDLSAVIEKKSRAIEILQKKAEKLETLPKPDSPGPTGQADGNSEGPLIQGSESVSNDQGSIQNVSNSSKKKSKKKKKGGKSSVEQDTAPQTDLKKEPITDIKESKESLKTDIVSKLQEELHQLRILIEEKDAAIERIHGKLIDQDGLREEIDTLRDDLVNVGQEHVESKDQVKELMAEKTAMAFTVTNLEKEIAELRGAHATSAAGSEQKHKDLAAQFEDLKAKANTLQTDLFAAQQLASSRFKDLNDLRNVLQKAQPEINVLRIEAAEVRSVKEALSKKDAAFVNLDSRYEELRSEVTKLKQTISDRETEIKTLNQKINQESNNRSKAEDASSKAAQEVQRLDTERRQATESLDRLSRELGKAREELNASKTKLRELEQQFSKIISESVGLKEELDLKTAQYASAQSLMASMRDQTAEMAMQMKEARERCESLDEEVADAHRLLIERSREGETMRKLLADVEGRADARTREMKERMDTAIEERDRAEDEASTAGRRRARELEDLRNKFRDNERNLKRAEEDKEELEVAQKDWKRRREELEHRAGQSTREVDDVRKAMAELRDALDESEKQARDLEKQKAELRRSVEDIQHRLEKMQKSNKSMADEMGKIQTARTKAMDSEAHSSRSSFDSAAHLGSPAAKSRTPSAALVDAPNGPPPGTMDYVYLKNVLLQFLEQKDKKHQVQLIPVLGMLLHFDRKDEQRWISAISTKG